MNNFKKSLCSVSIALALSTSASSFAQERTEQLVVVSSIVEGQDEQPNSVGSSSGGIRQGLFTGVSQDNDASIEIAGRNNRAHIFMDGTNNVSTIEQINTTGDSGNLAYLYSTSETDAAAANNTGNTNTMIQVGSNNRAESTIGVGSHNTLNVFQEGVNGRGDAVNQSLVNINGDGNSLDITQVGATDEALNVIEFNMTGDNNSATINVRADGAYLGSGRNASQASHFTGNNNTLVADFNDEGYSEAMIEFTGDNNSVTILTQGDSRSGVAKHINLDGMVGSDNTYVINSFGDGGYHNIGRTTGDDNMFTITDNGGFNNQTIMAGTTGSRNTIDITVEGSDLIRGLSGLNLVNLSKTDGNDNVTTVNMFGDSNRILHMGADGDDNTSTFTTSGTDNKIVASAIDNEYNPGFTPTTGDDNSLFINQEGDRNYAVYMDHGNDRDYKTVQIGNDNTALVRGLGDGKKVSVLQKGNGNDSYIKVDRVAGVGGKIGKKHVNTIITQDGDYNLINLDAKASSTITIAQTGSYNEVDLSIIGWNDAYAAIGPIIEIDQKGVGNIYQGELHSAQSSWQTVNQTGSDNFINWEEHGGAYNKAYMDQTGYMNTAYVTLDLDGSNTMYTLVDIDQIGAYNEADLDITGSHNGSTLWVDKDAGIAIYQEGEDNLLVGNNGFGFTINGDVNSLFVEQIGNGNTAAGHMVGTGNFARFYQHGDNNFASVTISAY